MNDLPRPVEEASEPSVGAELCPTYKWFITAMNRVTSWLDPCTLLHRMRGTVEPKIMFRKAMALINPFKPVVLGSEEHSLLISPDLAGPAIYILATAAILVFRLNWKDIPLLYQVGLSGCVGQYFMLGGALSPSLQTVMSCMGHGLIPVILISAPAALLPIGFIFGTLLVLVSTAWSTLIVTRLITLQTDLTGKYAIVVYPNAIVFSIISFLTLL
ncbi:protein YIPF7-like [Anabrus simplex]|uniref:protein YIPF7-like n=1 Tax=Anabrus simplex TaxID=316456 RepID=UPI0035A30574